MHLCTPPTARRHEDAGVVPPCFRELGFELSPRVSVCHSAHDSVLGRKSCKWLGHRRVLPGDAMPSDRHIARLAMPTTVPH